MTTISVDTSKAIKKMKPMHGGGQPPVLANAKDTYFHYLTEAGIPYSRLHDVGGSFGDGKYVDIPNISRTSMRTRMIPRPTTSPLPIGC